MISIRDAIDKYIDSVEEERESDGAYHPSSMFLCDRQAIYAVRAEPVTNPVDKKSKRRFYVGHRLHEIVQRAVEALPGITAFYPEFRVSIPELNIEGHGDGLIIFDDGTAVVLEAKSTKRIAVKFGLPKEEHKKQARIYAWAVKNHGVYAIDELGEEVFIPPMGGAVLGLLIVYLEKEELEVWEFFVPYEDSWDTEIVEKQEYLEAYRADPTSLPPRLPLKADGKKQWPCNYCPWKDRCWKVDPSEVSPREPF